LVPVEDKDYDALRVMMNATKLKLMLIHLSLKRNAWLF